VTVVSQPPVAGSAARGYVTREESLRLKFVYNLLYARRGAGLASACTLLLLQALWPHGALALVAALLVLVPLSSYALEFWLRRSTRIQLAGHIALAVDLVVITGTAVALGGLSSGVPALYLWVIVASGMLFRNRIVPFYAAACLVLSLILLGLETGGWLTSLPALPAPVPQIVRAVMLALSTIMVGLGATLLMRAQQQTAKEVELLNTEMERRVGAATLDLAEALRESKELHSRLNDSYENLSRMQRFRDEMIHKIVHDLKSPLSNILTTLDIVRMTLEAQGVEPESDEVHLVENARLSAEQMERLIGNLLDIHRIEEGRLAVRLEPVDLAPTLRERCQQLAARLAQKHLSLEAAIPDRLPAARADQALLVRVVDNLLDNAVKYTPSGGHILVSAQPEDHEVVVCVADSGPGIPPPDRERVFEKFEQLSGARHGDFGVGLGLAFCRLAVTAQGGHIWVAPDEEGAKFCVALERVAA